MVGCIRYVAKSPKRVDNSSGVSPQTSGSHGLGFVRTKPPTNEEGEMIGYRQYGCVACDEAVTGHTPWSMEGTEDCEDDIGDPIECPICGSTNVYVMSN